MQQLFAYYEALIPRGYGIIYKVKASLGPYVQINSNRSFNVKVFQMTLIAVLVFVFFLSGRNIYAVDELPASHPKIEATQEIPLLTGKVAETMNSGGYSYVLLEQKSGEKIWIATQEMKVVKGQSISFKPGQEMAGFESKTLKRTFDKIIFSEGPAGQDIKGQNNTTGSKGKVVSVTEKIKVEKASGPNAYTIAEIYKNKKGLDKKAIIVSGKVIKVSEGIMKKNWIHIQDGTGDPKKGDHNLVVTSKDVPAPGDVVTVSGTLYKDKDFGSGYKYDVIVEEAGVKKN